MVWNIEDYLEVVESLPEFSITKAEQDSLTYNAAFMKFSEMDYETKIEWDEKSPTMATPL